MFFFNTVATNESTVSVHLFNTSVRFVMVLLHCCFTVSTCVQNLVLLFWSTFPHVLRQTDHSMIIEPPLSVHLFNWPNYEWIFFHTALLKVSVSPFLEILNLEVILMGQMDPTINNWVVSLWDICGFPWAKCL
jgi:hypothetical protein